MHIDLEAPVIAVFGSNSTTPQGRKKAELRAAALLGEAIYRARAVLLTGAAPAVGGYSTFPDTVKDAAVWGAERPTATDRPTTWLGVARASRPSPAAQRGPGRYVVTPGWKDRRNLVETLICDAAIAIGCESAGTASEALFSLHAGRRLIILAEDPDDLDVSPPTLRRRARRKVRRAGDDLAVDQGIRAAYRWAKKSDVGLEARALPATDRAAAELVAELLEPDPRRRPRPDLGPLVDEDSWDAFVRDRLPSSRPAPIA